MLGEGRRGELLIRLPYLEGKISEYLPEGKKNLLCWSGVVESFAGASRVGGHFV